MSRERDQLLDKLDKAQAKFRRAYLAYIESRGKGKSKEATAFKSFRAADDELDDVVEEMQRFLSKHRNKNLH